MRTQRTFGTILAAFFLLSYASASLADVDWRSKGAVTPVKDQGQLDASWAFAAAGAIEGYGVAAGPGVLLSLSVQQLVDCAGVGDACDDPTCGQAPCGLNHGIAPGLCLATAYPYTALQGTCKNTCIPAATIPGWTRLQGEAGLQAGVNISPVLARLEIGGSGVDAFTSGVFSPTYWDDSEVQWVLVVGYDSQKWIIKNSRGPSWGQLGYLYLARGGNRLGIGNNVYAPSGATAHGACTLPVVGTCEDLSETDCLGAGGSYEGDLTFCPAVCPTCTAPVITATAKPRPTKKGAANITVTVAGQATEGCGLDASTAQYWVTDSYNPNAPIVPAPLTLNPDGSFSFDVTLAATRIGKRSHVYKVFISVGDGAGNTTVIAVAVPIT